MRLGTFVEVFQERLGISARSLGEPLGVSTGLGASIRFLVEWTSR